MALFPEGFLGVAAAAYVPFLFSSSQLPFLCFSAHPLEKRTRHEIPLSENKCSHAFPRLQRYY
jgi:hypothetical protein